MNELTEQSKFFVISLRDILRDREQAHNHVINELKSFIADRTADFCLREHEMNKKLAKLQLEYDTLRKELDRFAQS